MKLELRRPRGLFFVKQSYTAYGGHRRRHSIFIVDIES